MTSNIPNYIKLILRDFAQAPENYPGGTINPVHVAHDDWCNFWRGMPCNCNPIVTIDPPILPHKGKEKHGG